MQEVAGKGKKKRLTRRRGGAKEEFKVTYG
jgi:hypothetical protein